MQTLQLRIAVKDTNELQILLFLRVFVECSLQQNKNYVNWR